MNTNHQLHHQVHYATLWAAVFVIEGVRQAALRHHDLRHDERGVVSIEYVLIAAAAAAIAIGLGKLIWDAVNGVAENIDTEITVP